MAVSDAARQPGMVVREIMEVVIGIVLVGLALRDLFVTVVVPGESAGALRVARRRMEDIAVFGLTEGLKHLLLLLERMVLRRAIPR
ncbi:MAG: hypothetical protein JO141_32865 [Bradyrhizobium sp.]|nr:hypothetical protein [Bradyrhizobium sp.]